MANAVNYLSQIQTGQTIQAVHVNQFVDALSGSAAYDLVTSGSYTIIGPLYATASWATNALNAKTADSASKPYIASNASTNAEYTLVFKNDTGTLNNYYQLAADGTNGPYYNPSTNTLTVPVISGSSARITALTGSLLGDVNGSSSYSTTASYASTANSATTSTSTSGMTNYYIPSGSGAAVSGVLKMFAGASQTSTIPPFTAIVTVSPVDLTGKTLNQNLFLGVAPSQSGATVSATINSPTSITFVSNVANVDFTFVATYI
jgi:hypothetical protein